MDYGKRAEPASPGHALLWVPRVVLFPVYLVSEYVIRQPLKAFTVWVERHDVVETVKNIFTFGPTNNIGIVPTGLLDFRLRPSVGIYFFWDDFLAKDNALRIHVATGGVRLVPRNGHRSHRNHPRLLRATPLRRRRAPGLCLFRNGPPIAGKESVPLSRGELRRERGVCL